MNQFWILLQYCKMKLTMKMSRLGEKVNIEICIETERWISCKCWNPSRIVISSQNDKLIGMLEVLEIWKEEVNNKSKCSIMNYCRSKCTKLRNDQNAELVLILQQLLQRNWCKMWIIKNVLIYPASLNFNIFTNYILHSIFDRICRISTLALTFWCLSFCIIFSFQQLQHFDRFLIDSPSQFSVC